MLLLFLIGTGALLLIYGFFTQGKKIKTHSCDLSVAYFAEKLNRTISGLEDDAQELAVLGTLFYKADDTTHSLIDFAAEQTFRHSRDAVGGGIWFEPYVILPAKQRFCTYAFKKGKNIVVDRGFEDHGYDYHNQMWYKFIKNKVITKNKLSFTRPYYDPIGTNALMITFGQGIFDKKGKFVGMSTVDWQMDEILNDISNLKPTKSSFALFADKENDYIFALTENDESQKSFWGKSLTSIPWYSTNLKNGDIIKYKNRKYISFSRNLSNNNMIFIVNVPQDELFADAIKRFTLTIVLVISGAMFLALLMYIILLKNVNKPIDYMVKTAEKIGSGNLDEKMSITSPAEFATLATSFNKMTSDLQDYITNLNKAKATQQKIEEELEIARSIQSSILPNVFPPYPDRTDFEIFASMTPAKEVGGDFYDFFFIDENNFAFLIADVSGKGVPAALFMMTAKTMLKNLAKSKMPLDELMTYANEQLCKNNKEGYFVTVFMCVINLLTGEVSFVNAGHNPPLIKKADNQFEYFKTAPNFVLGTLKGFKYKSSSFSLDPDDCIFLYTDGVTEAQNKNAEFYGEKRLLSTLNILETPTVNNLLESTNANLKLFVDGEEQSDDITMLALQYHGQKENSFLCRMFKAQVEDFPTLIGWLEETFPDMSMADRAKLNVVVEEIFANIVNYAYPEGNGNVLVELAKDDDFVELTFKDKGIPYNPLKNEEPDITLSASDRQIGGLGILIVKKTMDFVYYKFENGQNILTIKMYTNKAKK